MTDFRKGLLAVSMLGAIGTASAQNYCPDIAKTLKEYSIDSSSTSYLNAVFTQHCQQDGSRKSSGASAGLDAVVKAIPIKFTGNYSNSDEAFSNFCKQYQSQTTANAASDSYKETISLKSLETIQQCLSLQASGVVISHLVRNAESADFYLRGSVTNSLEVKGVSTTGPVTCSGLVDKKVTAIDSAFGTDVKSTLNFACKRSGRAAPTNSATSFDESTITVMTSAGNYSLFWPKDERQSQDMATDIDKRITSAEGAIATLGANVNPLVMASSIPAHQCPTGAASSHDAKWMYVGCNGQISAEPTCTNFWLLSNGTSTTEVRACAAKGNIKLFK